VALLPVPKFAADIHNMNGRLEWGPEFWVLQTMFLVKFEDF
jgi:hypothetical protein